MQTLTCLKADDGYTFECTKTYAHSVGLSCAFRQWRAKDTHCRFLHGYSLKVTIVFGSHELDDRNWVVNFGGLKRVKEYLEGYFDHKTLVARDDPEFQQFVELNTKGIIQMLALEHVGCEAFAKHIHDMTSQLLGDDLKNRAWIQSVTVAEHEGNSATYRRKEA